MLTVSYSARPWWLTTPIILVGACYYRSTFMLWLFIGTSIYILYILGSMIPGFEKKSYFSHVIFEILYYDLQKKN